MLVISHRMAPVKEEGSSCKQDHAVTRKYSCFPVKGMIQIATTVVPSLKKNHSDDFHKGIIHILGLSYNKRILATQ